MATCEVSTKDLRIVVLKDKTIDLVYEDGKEFLITFKGPVLARRNLSENNFFDKEQTSIILYDVVDVREL